MPRITDYTTVSSLNRDDVFVLDGTNGTRAITYYTLANLIGGTITDVDHATTADSATSASTLSTAHTITIISSNDNEISNTFDGSSDISFNLNPFDLNIRSVYREKNLTEQGISVNQMYVWLRQLATGKYNSELFNFYIGDYFVNNTGTKIRLADINYFINLNYRITATLLFDPLDDETTMGELENGYNESDFKSYNLENFIDPYDTFLNYLIPTPICESKNVEIKYDGEDSYITKMDYTVYSNSWNLMDERNLCGGSVFGKESEFGIPVTDTQPFALFKLNPQLISPEIYDGGNVNDAKPYFFRNIGNKGWSMVKYNHNIPMMTSGDPNEDFGHFRPYFTIGVS